MINRRSNTIPTPTRTTERERVLNCCVSIVHLQSINSHDLPLRESHIMASASTRCEFNGRIFSMLSSNSNRRVSAPLYIVSKIGLHVFCGAVSLTMSLYAWISHLQCVWMQSVANMLEFFAQFHLAADSSTQTENDSQKKEFNESIACAMISLHACTHRTMHTKRVNWIETIQRNEQEIERTWYTMIACPLFCFHSVNATKVQPHYSSRFTPFLFSFFWIHVWMHVSVCGRAQSWKLVVFVHFGYHFNQPSA